MAQDNNVFWLQKDSTFKIQPYLMVQWWNTYSYDMQIDENKDGIFEPVDNRFNSMIRRARMGFKANPYAGLKFRLVTFYDGVGIDALSAIAVSPNNGNVNFGIWDAYLQWQPFNGNQAINLVAGYFRPQLGRESITSAFATTSGEKALQQSYIRHHLVGAANGRATGFNVGGLLYSNKNNVGINYNLGIFNPVHGSAYTTSGINWAPLAVARTVFYLGEPEMYRYKIGYITNYYNQRRGLSLGIGGAWQGNTDLFNQSRTTSVDVLLNWDKFNLDADLHFMSRQAFMQTNASDEIINYNYSSGHIRGSYNLTIGNKILEPVAMLMLLQAGETAEAQSYAGVVGAFSGTEEYLNLGFNYYLNTHRLKLIAHYTRQDGTPGYNIYSYVSGLDLPVRRGDYFVVGLNAVF